MIENSLIRSMVRDSNHTFTENGADALKSTGNSCLDFYGLVGALRGEDSARITRLFADAYKENPLFATKITFYCRDIRGGLGERDIFRTLIKYMAIHHPESLIKNIPLIGEYGRFDDLYALVDTPLEKHMWKFVSIQLQQDIEDMRAGKPVSLLAKWLKTADASSKNTRRLGINTAISLGMRVPTYKKTIKTLRKYIDIVERKISAGNWDSIDYSTVPSRASLIYKNAFSRHDNERYAQYITDTLTGTTKINTGTLYPYDLVHSYIIGHSNFRDIMMDNTIESLWKNLPNYVEGENNVLVVADTSGSMFEYNKNIIAPIDVALSLAVYFAERNTGSYHNIWMNFSDSPTPQVLKGETLLHKLMSIDMDNWGCSTNLVAVFDYILKCTNNPKDLPVAIIIISDMEINPYLPHYYNKYIPNTGKEKDNWNTFYSEMRSKFANKGWEIPNIVFWNVRSRHDIFHASKDLRGVQLASGASASTFKSVIDAIGLTPVEAMLKTINSERYAPISILDYYDPKSYK